MKCPRCEYDEYDKRWVVKQNKMATKYGYTCIACGFQGEHWHMEEN